MSWRMRARPGAREDKVRATHFNKHFLSLISSYLQCPYEFDVMMYDTSCGL